MWLRLSVFAALNGLENLSKDRHNLVRVAVP